MKVTHKDFLMELKKSPGRFLSMLFIVALGVAFFSGIRASEPSMRVTGDAYFDGADLMDVKAVSTLGITREDIQAFNEADTIEKAEGAYSVDVLSDTKDDQFVLHMMTLPKNMNKVTVSKGRMPEKAGECLADEEMDYKIGDRIVVKSGTDDPLSDTLTTDTYTVVGIGNSPCYISFNRGSTTIGKGTIDGFLVVSEDTFALDTYTEACMQVKGTKTLTAYTDAYEKKVEKATDQIETLGKKRGRIRRQELVNEANDKIAKAEKKLEKGKKTSGEKLKKAEKKIKDGEKKLSAGKKELADGRQKLVNARKTLKAKEKELDQGEKEYRAGKAQLRAGRQKLKKGWSEYRTNEAQYEQMSAQMAGIEAATSQLAEAKAKLEAGKKELEASEAKLTASERKLAKAKAKLKSGRKQIKNAYREISEQEKKLTKGEQEFTESEKKLEKAKASYKKGKKEAQEKIKKAEKKVSDAKKKVADIPKAKWYIADRNDLPEYTSYGENADRMRAIGKVFPVIFFLVAALISLTSMTRMVEEQRTQIGTMKALGYGKAAIASKYIGYALLASAIGSVMGFLIGEKIFPFIIIYAYGIMYLHIPEILIPYHWGYAAFASGVAVACTLLATIEACYRELGGTPAVLMRPPAPKIGRRVFLERIGFLWKHLSFTWKSTIRNLMRYKKRFFMTIFGIGGCMALMLVGFGLRDSIFEIADLQYSEIQYYDGSVYLKENLTEKEIDNLDDFLTKDSDVIRHMKAKMQSVTLAKGKKKRATYECVFGEPEDVRDYVHFRDRRSHTPYKLTDDGAIISEKTAKLLNAKAGDTIRIKDEENGDKKVKILKICENYMGHYLYLTPACYEKIYGEKPEYNCFLFTIRDGYSQKQKEDAGKKILARKEVLNVSYMHEIREQLDDMLKSLNLVIVVLIISAGMLAFVVLYNLNNINIAERQRELATLKVLGFYDQEVGAYVYRENLILTLIGAGVGIGIGRILHLFIIQTVEVDAAMFGRNINPPSYLYSFLFTVLFSIIINGVMYFKLRKIDMVESLKSVE